MTIPEKPFLKACRALDGAKLARERMATAAVFERREHEWRSFLNSLDQVLEKLRKGYKGIGGQVEPWLGSQVATQRADPLLLYLAEARNADQHSVQDCVELKPSHYEFTVPGSSPDGGPVVIERLVARGGRVVEYRGNVAPVIRDEPARMEALSVTNWRRRYDPPGEHRDPMDLADLAIAHSEKVLTEFKARFLPPP